MTSSGRHSTRKTMDVNLIISVYLLFYGEKPSIHEENDKMQPARSGVGSWPQSYFALMSSSGTSSGNVRTFSHPELSARIFSVSSSRNFARRSLSARG